MGRPFIDLNGQVFGQLTVLKLAGTKRRFADWLCLCVCGREIIVRSDALKKGQHSCGCVFRLESSKRLYRHGFGGTKIYQAWRHMLRRCYNPNDANYKHYGGRGITVCETWRISVTNFVADMGEPPTCAHSLDRIDNNGNYTKDNCRWTTIETQANNRRGNLAWK